MTEAEGDRRFFAVVANSALHPVSAGRRLPIAVPETRETRPRGPQWRYNAAVGAALLTTNDGGEHLHLAIQLILFIVNVIAVYIIILGLCCA
jgi:hypothetical protein